MGAGTFLIKMVRPLSCQEGGEGTVAGQERVVPAAGQIDTGQFQTGRFDAQVLDLRVLIRGHDLGGVPEDIPQHGLRHDGGLFFRRELAQPQCRRQGDTGGKGLGKGQGGMESAVPAHGQTADDGVFPAHAEAEGSADIVRELLPDEAAVVAARVAPVEIEEIAGGGHEHGQVVLDGQVLGHPAEQPISIRARKAVEQDQALRRPFVVTRFPHLFHINVVGQHEREVGVLHYAVSMEFHPAAGHIIYLLQKGAARTLWLHRGAVPPP